MESVRSYVERAPVGTFLRSRDLIAEFGERTAVDLALHRLKGEHGLVSVRRGLYYKGHPTRFGPTRPDPLTVGYEVARSAGFESGVGPSGFTAARALGITTQVPHRVEVSVPGRAPADTADVHFSSRTWSSRRTLNPLEIAVLELLRSWPRYSEVSWPTFVTVVGRLVRDGEVSIDAVRDAARRERHLAARARAEDLSREVQAGE